MDLTSRSRLQLCPVDHRLHELVLANVFARQSVTQLPLQLALFGPRVPLHSTFPCAGVPKLNDTLGAVLVALCCPSSSQLGMILATMIQREKIDELLNLPVDERRRVLRLLQESLPPEGEPEPTNGDQTSPAAKWLLSMAGRYSGGPGNTAVRADEILRAEIDKRDGLTTK
jgi:hypothetical protein